MYESDPVVFAHDGEVLAIRTLALTLFFETGTVDRVALGVMASEAIGLVAPHARWMRFDEMTRNKWIDTALLQTGMAFVKDSLLARADGVLIIDSGSTIGGVGQWSFQYVDTPSEEGEVLGSVQLHMPICSAEGPIAADKAADALLRLALRWTGEVNFFHGYGGLSVNYDQGDINARRDMALRGHAERYLGFNLSDLVTERRGLLAQLKNAQWLTFLGNAMLSYNPVHAELLWAWPGSLTTAQGLLLRAGERPEAGDVHRGEDLPALRELNEMLQPWLVDNLFPMPGFFPDEEAVRRWLHSLRPHD